MSIITISSILITLCAICSYINYLFLKLPNAIGIMLVALLFSILIVLSPYIGFDLRSQAGIILRDIDFTETLMHGMLSFLLFAGALHVNLSDLGQQKWIIGILAFFGTIFSTFATGFAVYYIAALGGFNIPLAYAFVFGALISPTDPVAVMAILKKAGCKKSLETKVVGESLFNDGIAVVIFIALLGIATDGNASASNIAILFLQEAVGGIVFGLIIGSIIFYFLKKVDNYQVEILLTLALVMGGYELAHYLHISGPIAMVIAGLIIGNYGREHAMSENTKKNLDNFWELIDEFLNAVLFMLIGLSILVLEVSSAALVTGFTMIFILLLIRFIAVYIPVLLLKKIKDFSDGVVNILTWGGLRGGISVALVLSLPEGEIRDFLMVVTYCIVLFSIIVQGLTIGKLVKKI